MAKPIPKALLIHSATLHTVHKDEWRQNVIDKSVDLSCIRIEKDNKQHEDGQGMHSGKAALLFYDMKNSAPQGVSFQPGQLVEFRGESFEVYAAELLEDTAPHHWEVMLR